MVHSRKIALISVAPCDYGIYRSLAGRISTTAGARLQLIATAAVPTDSVVA